MHTALVITPGSKENLTRQVSKPNKNVVLLKYSNYISILSISLHYHSSSCFLVGNSIFASLKVALFFFFFVCCKYKRYFTQVRVAAATKHLLFPWHRHNALGSLFPEKMVAIRTFQSQDKLRKTD